MGLGIYELHGNGSAEGKHEGVIIMNTTEGVPLPLGRFASVEDAESFLKWLGQDPRAMSMVRLIDDRDRWYTVREKLTGEITQCADCGDWGAEDSHHYREDLGDDFCEVCDPDFEEPPHFNSAAEAEADRMGF